MYTRYKVLSKLLIALIFCSHLGPLSSSWENIWETLDFYSSKQQISQFDMMQ